MKYTDTAYVSSYDAGYHDAISGNDNNPNGHASACGYTDGFDAGRADKEYSQ